MMSPFPVLDQATPHAWKMPAMTMGFSSDIMSRVWVMIILFSVSLFAAWFPTLSKRIQRLRVPRIVFFIGKHFGTGVILSTAFVHLLQEAFENLGHPLVQARWGIGRWTGLIVLGSLLVIFLIEYISTSFVDRLQSYPSPASTPPHSSPTSRSVSTDAPRTHDPESRDISEHAPLLPTSTNEHEYGTLPPVLTHPHSHHPHTHERSIEEVLPREHLPHRSVSVAALPPPAEDDIFSGGHHRFENRSSHSHHSGGPGRRQSLQKISEDFTVSVHGTVTPVAPSLRTQKSQGQLKDGHGGGRGHHDHGAHHRPHNTSHSHDHGHVHLTMEEWDPDARHGHEEEEEGVEVTAEVKIGHRRQVVGILMLQIGIMIHSLVIGLTLAITTGSEFTSLVAAIIFHQLFEGLSLGIRIANLPSTPLNAGWIRRVFKLTLAFTFAITTPIGIAIGLATFGHGQTDAAYLKLIQGLMSAISAGMLIYAACVEMLAGDFVMDPLLWRSSIKRQVLAMGSVFMGVAGMALIG